MKITFTVSIAILTGLSAAGPLPQATSAAACTTYTMLFARGTTETGTLGTVVGPGLQKSVQSALGADQVTVKVCRKEIFVVSTGLSSVMYNRGLHMPPTLVESLPK